MTRVVLLPVSYNCTDCENFLSGPRGLWCAEFREEIIDPEVAQECPFFEHY